MERLARTQTVSTTMTEADEDGIYQVVTKYQVPPATAVYATLYAATKGFTDFSFVTPEAIAHAKRRAKKVKRAKRYEKEGVVYGSS